MVFFILNSSKFVEILISRLLNVDILAIRPTWIGKCAFNRESWWNEKNFSQFAIPNRWKKVNLNSPPHHVYHVSVFNKSQEKIIKEP